MATFGYTDNINSNDGAVRLALGNEGTYHVRIRANADGIYLGGYQVDSNPAGAPGTGFKLIQGRDYSFQFLGNTGAAVGSDDLFGVYLATTSATDVSFSVFFTPTL